MNYWKKTFLALAACTPFLMGSSPAADWKAQLAEDLPLLGHRNWIVVVDSAYPLQTSPGIETIYTGASQTEVVRAVLDALAKTPHVRPIIYTDSELKSVPEKDAPGIDAYRKELTALLGDRPLQVLLHEKIIAKLDEAGKTFHILVLKTNLTLPYTQSNADQDGSMDRTHFTVEGAKVIAGLVAKELAKVDPKLASALVTPSSSESTSPALQAH